MVFNLYLLSVLQFDNLEALCFELGNTSGYTHSVLWDSPRQNVVRD